MTVKELLEWGVIKRDFSPGERRRRFAAETDILGMVMRVFRKRELHWIETLISRLEEARRILEDEGRTSVPDDLLRNRFLVTRIDALLTLAKVGRRVVDRFVRAGTLDLRGLRGALGRRGRTG
jgi:DNA-binding transcriptional regulator GbsR (MarR family)